MASLSKGNRIIKTLTPEQVSKALAEWLLVRGGYQVDAAATVTTQFAFDRGQKRFHSCRVDLEIL